MKYHNFEEIRKQELESTLSEEETRERNIYSSKMFEKKKNQNNMPDYTRLTYFIDHNGKIQIIYLKNQDHIMQSH